MKIRIPKVRITRPAGPLAKDGLDYLSESERRTAAEHDRAIQDYAPATVAAAWNDLQGREVWDRKNPEHRWVLARRAALRRLGVAMRERGEA